MNLLRLALVLLGLWAGTSVAETPFVYSRCPRTSTVVNGLPNGDIVEMLPETGRILSDFVAPCDLVYDDGQGGERILFSCIASSTNSNACAALDAAVSFDAKTVAFSVFRGPMIPFRMDGRDYPGKSLQSTEAQLHLVDVATGRITALPHATGDFDFGPAFLANGRLAFTSTRARAFQTAVTCGNTNGIATQIYTMDLDGRNSELASHHSLGSELHPYPLKDGRLAYSSWQLFGALPWRHPNAPGECGTRPNMFHLYVQNPDGAVPFALYGQHLSEPTLSGANNEYEAGLRPHMAAHFITQSTDGRVWTGEYYRSNNLGLGNIVGFPVPAAGVEGMGYAAAPLQTVFRPRNTVALTKWASQADQEAGLMPSPSYTAAGYATAMHYAGKLGHPAALPGNGLMMTWGLGACTTATGKQAHVAAADYAAAYGDNPYCDTGIYKYPGALPATPTPLTHPSQLVKLVNRKEFHEFMARAVVPYDTLMGQPKPTDVPTVEAAPPVDPMLEPGTPFAVLGASSLIHRETHPAEGFRFNSAFGNFALQGADTGVYADDEICGVRILGVLPAREQEHQKHSVAPAGERTVILGEFPVRKFASDGSQPHDALNDPDTSFRVRLPANFPYLMQTIDCRGLTLNTDQTWQHVRPGEVKTCNGCHVHSDTATELPFANTEAAKPNATLHRLGEGTIPLLDGAPLRTVGVTRSAGWGLRVEFDADVWPIFQRRCVSCHGATSPGGGLRLDVPRARTLTGEYPSDGSTLQCLVDDVQQRCVGAGGTKVVLSSGGLLRPQLSKWVHLLSARLSLLYWKAANRRADGMTDSTASNDVDFGSAHPTSITADELATLGRWLDTGAGWGPDFAADTIRPTLHVVGVTRADALEGLEIGTVDVGDGIRADSLQICVKAPGQSCTSITAPLAATAGVAHVTLASPLTNPDTEVTVSVRDVAGNTTTDTRTVGWFLHRPPPTAPDGGFVHDAGVLLPMDSGVTMPEPDAGTTPPDPDGGTVDPPTTQNDAGISGPVVRPEPDGVIGQCGCSSGPLSLGLLGLSMVLRRRRVD